MCRGCRQIVPARVFFRDGKVWQQSLCPQCESQAALIACDKDWYLDNVLKEMPDHSPLHGAQPCRQGCPHDCGPCVWHASPCQLPVISITNACNLRCPVCFTYNREDRIYYMPVEEMRRTVDWIVESSGRVDLINLTGGEPTLHPDLPAILAECRRPEIGRITMNSNGLRLAEDPNLCRQLADLGVYVILSFNTFDPGVSRRMHGRDLTAIKQQAVDNLATAGVRMTLLHVMVRDLNEDAIGGLLELMRTRDNILSLTVQTMTYTGQGGGGFPDRRHVPVDEAARLVCDRSGGELRFNDFVSRPAAHPLCYLICYMLRDSGRMLPFARFANASDIERLMSESYLIRLGDEERFFRNVVDDLYARGDEEYLPILRRVLDRLYPSGAALEEFDRQRIGEESVRTVYVHAHMDEDTFDCSRAMMCPDLVPAEPGRLIPACTYNLFYRMKDERFYVD